MFQSSPDPEAGCIAKPLYPVVPSGSFQSSPDPEAGCDDMRDFRGWRNHAVSILTWPERQDANFSEKLAHIVGNRFQSAPDCSVGCDLNMTDFAKVYFQFQSSPGPKAGRS